MSEMTCLNCGREMQYDWAPCPNCGWKPPEAWENSAEEEENEGRPHPTLLSKKRPWVQWTVWLLVAAALVGLLIRFLHF